MSPRSALPEHLNDPEEIEKAFPDDAKLGRLWRWFKKATKTWFVFGPRCTERWARWREWPKVLMAFGDGSPWRFENDVLTWYFPQRQFTWWVQYHQSYLSRVQYDKKWHIQIQWPLFFLVQIGQYEMYVGFKRDADKVYWLAMYLGRIWK